MKTIKKLLIANRGEIAIRIARAAADLELHSTSIYSEEDATSLHRYRTDEAIALEARGVPAYLDIDRIVEIAKEHQCDAVHPGYGFLSENADFADRLHSADIFFVGPRPDVLKQLGDKVAARQIAKDSGVPVLEGSSNAVSLHEAIAFFESLPEGQGMLIKAVGGGGGRGMRLVTQVDEIEEAYTRCASEAKAAFGNDALYAEHFFAGARHVEVQLVGDEQGNINHLWERECTLQRRHQKLVEVAPSPSLSGELRQQILDAAVSLGKHLSYSNLGTVEFLVSPNNEKTPFAFIEVNPRLQVEHTVTEVITDVDLVRTQLLIADGQTLDQLSLAQDPRKPSACAVQLRINMETMESDGSAKAAGGKLDVFELPNGPDVRVDTYGYSGYVTSPAFDSLLAKVIVRQPDGDWPALLNKAKRCLAEMRVSVPTNKEFISSLLAHPKVMDNEIDTRFVETHIAELVEQTASVTDDAAFPRGADTTPAPGTDTDVLPPDCAPVLAPMPGSIIAIEIEVGSQVSQGQAVMIMEAMKMEHVIQSPTSGTVQKLRAAVGEAVFEGAVLAVILEHDVVSDGPISQVELDPDFIRPDLAEVFRRHSFGLDENRPEKVAKRHARGYRTARENLADLIDEGSFVEYGPLALAAQTRRRSLEDLLENTTSDGLVAGIGRVNSELFADSDSRVIAMSYDWMVLAGTQGMHAHEKKDRLFLLAEQYAIPLVLLAEGGGGRSGDTDIDVACPDSHTFSNMARLSGRAPVVGVNNGYCFAGNAALLACCDVIISTKGSNIGMGGPPMIETGGLGSVNAEDIGPMDVLSRNGAVDIVVEDEAEAIAVTKRYLSYFQGDLDDWDCADQRKLRHVIPENRVRVYDMHELVTLLADTDSVLELRENYGIGVITALVRIEGKPMGVVANNPKHLSGAVDSDAAHKASRFIQLCDAFDIPLLLLCDTPGFMVGVQAEETGQLRHFGRMFVTAANISVPTFSVITRKCYGLGAMAMGGACFKETFFCVAWPTGEFGMMGVEGDVELAFSKELAAIENDDEREKFFQKQVAEVYERGSVLRSASMAEIDDVIDPADTRKWLAMGLKTACMPPRIGKKRPNVDTW
ncbi:MAG: carbamoyl-phosphate synthase large subunit [Halieaceae bacterium]|nr:carbamoyl-phosphate synthase large subunit [Halieaceae bacterium]